MPEHRAGRIIAHIYRGPTEPEKHNRGVRSFEGWFRKIADGYDDPLYLPSSIRRRGVMDGLLVYYARKALEEGRSKITVLDLGSGAGGLSTSLKSDPAIVPQTRAFLWNHPDFHVDIVGLTDAPSEEMFLKELPLKINNSRLGLVDQTVNKQISIRNVACTLTRVQTLKDFLQVQGITELDIIFAIKSLRYLPRVIFEETIQSGVNFLVPEGRFLAYHYARNVPGYAGARDTGFNTNADPATPRGKEVYNFVEFLNFNTPDVPFKEVLERVKADREYRNHLKRALRLYAKLGVLKGIVIEFVEREVKESLPQTAKAADKQHIIDYGILSLCYTRLQAQRRLMDHTVKRNFLLNLSGVDLKFISTEQTEGTGFVLKKH